MQRLRLFLCILSVFISATFCSQALAVSTLDADLVQFLESKKIKVVVMRHGEAVNNLRNLTLSTRSPGLYVTAEGKKQVRQAGRRLKKEDVQIIYTSPLYRTLQTAQQVNQALKLPYQKIRVDDRLAQQYFGIFEGKTFSEFKEYFSSLDSMYEDAVPGGELGTKVFERTRNFLWQMAFENNNQTVLIVTHAFNCAQINKCLTGSYENFPKLGEFVIYDFSSKPGCP